MKNKTSVGAGCFHHLLSWGYKLSSIASPFENCDCELSWLNFKAQLVLLVAEPNHFNYALTAIIGWCRQVSKSLTLLVDDIARISVQSLIHVWLFATPWTAEHQASLSITNSWSLLRFMSIESVMPSNHLILCHPFLFLPSIFPNIRVFSSESVVCIRWPEYWNFRFSNNPFSEYSGLISLKINWFDLLAVQGTPKSLLQHHSSKACSSMLSFLYSPALTSIHDYWKP